MTRQNAIRQAKSWLGTPYHHHANIKGAGVDCAQFLIEVFHRIGAIPRIDVGDYPADWHLHRGDEQYLKWIEQYAVKVEKPQMGDILLFKFGRCVSHGAILMDDDTVIHSYFRQGVVMTRLTDAELAGRMDSCWSLWGDA